MSSLPTSINAQPSEHHDCRKPRIKRWHKNTIWSCPTCGRIWVCRDVYDDTWEWIRTDTVIAAGSWFEKMGVKE